MGFPLVEGSFWGRVAPLLVFNTERAYDLSTIGLEPGDDPATILRNGSKIVDLLKSETARTIVVKRVGFLKKYNVQHATDEEAHST